MPALECLAMIACLLSVTPASSAPCQAVPTRLRCEYLVNPIGVEEPRPRLSWELAGSGENAHQSAYRILVATRPDLLAEGRADLWDSGKTASSATCQVEYNGRPLQPLTQAWWTVQTWDARDVASGWSKPAHWTCGPGPTWTARWIGDPASYPEPVPPRNGFHTEIAHAPDVDKWVMIQLDTPVFMDGVRLWPARPYDWQPDTPGFLFPLRFRIEAAAEPGGTFRVLLDHTERDHPSPGDQAVTFRFPRTRLHALRLHVTRLRQRDPGNFAMALAEMEGLDGDNVVTRGAKVTASDSIETGPWAAANLTDGDRTSHPARDAGPLPPLMARKEFTLEAVPRRAVLFVSALGLYEVYLNGKRVGDAVLAPEWTDYRRRVQYQGYDVTSLLRKGTNVVAALLGDGWFAGRIGLFPGRGHYGRRPELLAQLHADGATQPILITDASWKVTADGPVRAADILDGETVDARKEMPGWLAAGFDDSRWQNAAVFEHPALQVVAQPNEPIRITRELKPVALTQPSPGTWVFDMGQNMVGWVRLRLREHAGTAVRLRFGEMLNDDGTLYTANLRGAAQTDTYICRGDGDETFEPHFTYHGFRYVEVTGLTRKPALNDITGRVFHSAAPELGTFECSDPSLNRLWQNILWTQRANLMSTPTDCPQRDERLGWMGDIQTFGPTACFNMDLAAFFTKWLQDVRDAQADDGRFPDFAPNPAGSNSQFSGTPAWGDAGVFLPWLVYNTYGDRRLLARHFDAVLRWIAWIEKNNPDHIWRNARGNDYNDWLNGDTLIAEGWPTKGAEVPREVFATAFWAHSTELAARMADVLGRSDDAARLRSLSNAIRTAFQRAFVQPDGTILGNTQAGYALALHFDLLPEALRPAAVEHLLAAIDAYKGHISTGIQTTHRMMLELSRAGRHDVAYRLLMNRTFPSWLYTVDNGATTIWERWDGYVKGRGFQNPGMNSFNHWALGAVGEWMMKVILGLQPADAPGPDAQTAWQRFRLSPVPGGGLTWARGAYHTIHGTIAVEWRTQDGRFDLKLTVPANCTAELQLPATPRLLLDGKPFAPTPAVQPQGTRQDRRILLIHPGTNTFSCL